MKEYLIRYMGRRRIHYVKIFFCIKLCVNTYLKIILCTIKLIQRYVQSVKEKTNHNKKETKQQQQQKQK